MKDNDPFRSFAKLVVRGMRRFGCLRFGNEVSKDEVEHAGFVNVRTSVKKIPVGAWARDKRLQHIGMLMKTALAESLSAYAAKPLEALRIPAEERKRLVDTARKSLDDKRIHRYVKLRFVYGQKGPEHGLDFDV